MPGAESGRKTVRKAVKAVAPSERLASVSRRSIPFMLE